jgi:hypothetical protein
VSQALIAVVSLLIGAGLNEWIRRSNRIESYTATVFQKRFAIYEELWKRIYGWRSVADKVIEDTALTAQHRHELISEVVLDICGFCDENSLYLNEEVTFQCAALFMGVEEIQAESDAAKRKEMVSDFSGKYKQTLDIIRAEAGLRRMNKLFQTVTNAKYSSDLIEHFRQAQKEHRRRSRR